MSVHPKLSALLKAVLGVCVVAATWGGCGRAPNSVATLADALYADYSPPPALRSSAGAQLSHGEEVGQGGWQTVIDKEIDKGKDKTVAGGRYTVRFFKQSLSHDIDFKLRERPGTIHFELSPDGQVFGNPVELTINYSGTNADPSSPNYDSTTPVLYVYNATTRFWEPLPGWNNTAQRIYTARLPHFCLWILSGKAGW
jgi:hypothetical protein